jgi:hypothetical protein
LVLLFILWEEAHLPEEDRRSGQPKLAVISVISRNIRKSIIFGHGYIFEQ